MNLVCVACEDTRGKGENTLNILQQCCTYQFDFSKNKISTSECFHLRKVKILVLTYYADSSCQVICFLWKVIFQTMTSRNMLGWNFFLNLSIKDAKDWIIYSHDKRVAYRDKKKHFQVTIKVTVLFWMLWMPPSAMKGYSTCMYNNERVIDQHG